MPWPGSTKPVAEPITRAEVLREFGTLLAKMREKVEQERDKGKQPSDATKRRIDVLHTGYEFIMKNWAPE
jgi:hypothetical protein